MCGSDKLMMDIDGEPLLRRVTRRALRCGNVFVAVPAIPHARCDALAGLNVQFVEVPDASEGMGASLRTAISHLPSDTQVAMVTLADLPDLTAADLNKVAHSVSDHPGKTIWRGTSSDGKPGHPVVFSSALFCELRTLGGDRGAGSVIAAHSDDVHLVTLPGNNALTDLDTPENWRDWRAGR